MLKFALGRPPGVFVSLAFLAGFAHSICAVADTRIRESYRGLPLRFERNDGQTHQEVRFLARGPAYSLYLTSREAVLVLAKRGAPAAVRMALVGARADPLVIGLDELPGKANYFTGSDPAKWRTNVPTYAKVRYEQVYPGVDLVYYGKQRQLEYDFIVAPGADPKQIVLGLEGAERLEIDAHGDLVLYAGGDSVRLHKPVVYQERDGVRHDIAGRYVLKRGNRVGFKVAVYDRARPLVIDPVLAYSTYLGGRAEDRSYAIAVDASGNAYVTGFTGSTDFPTTPAAFHPFSSGSTEVFVTKLNPSGSTLIYSTYLGGSSADEGFAIAVDAAGNAYVTGVTASSDFPTTTGAFQTMGSGVFVVKLNAAGSALVYSTYVGDGGFSNRGTGIAVAWDGSAYIAGGAGSGFPTTPGAVQATFGGRDGVSPQGDAFIARLNPTGSALVYSTFLGGDRGDVANAISLDPSGNAYVTGLTTSANFPTTLGVFQPIAPGGGDAFVAKLNPDGSALVYSTFLGGSSGDIGNGIAVDAAGNAYVTGSSGSGNFPTTEEAFQPVFRGGVFVTKLNPTGSALVYSTYLSGGFATAIAVDAAGSAHVTGTISTGDLPTTPDAFQSSPSGGGDAFITKLNPDGSALVYSTYLGGGGIDEAHGIALDSNGNAYLTGSTGTGLTGNNFPTTAGAFQPNFGGIYDAFAAKLHMQSQPPPPARPRHPRRLRGGEVRSR